MIEVLSDVTENFPPTVNQKTFEKEYEAFLKRCLRTFGEKLKEPVSTCLMDDLIVIKEVASGMFGTVFLVQHSKTRVYHAMKAIEKHIIISQNKLAYVKSEKMILNAVRFPFSVHLDYFYQDNSYIYFVMPFIAGGELFEEIKKCGKIIEPHARFYAAQIVLVLEYLHYVGVVYRDLKPENILIDHRGYVKVTDFGISKILKGRTWTLCGTPEYLAPEILLRKGYGMAIDWWSLGVLIYEMSYGRSPFWAVEEGGTIRNILENNYRFPKHFSNDLRNIIENLLQSDLTRRYGNLSRGIKDIKEHPWFKHLEWLSLLKREIQPPFVPDIEKLYSFSEISSKQVSNSFNLKIESSDHYATYFKDF